MPRLARQMHLATVVRSMHHGVNNAHAAAVYAAMTGHDRGEVGGGTLPTDNPSPGSVLGTSALRKNRLSRTYTSRISPRKERLGLPNLVSLAVSWGMGTTRFLYFVTLTIPSSKFRN
ncbi:MAG: hypothetical protein R3C11_08205 [Planctomycetaceae bacterium]